MARLGAQTLFRTALVAALCGLPAVCGAQPVSDSTRAAARSLGAAGVSAYQAGDYATANDKLERAYQLLKAPSLGLWSARALEKVGKLVEAGERYTEVTRLTISGGDAAVQASAQSDARKEQDALSARIPTLTIQADGASASKVEITLDGESVSSVLIGEKQPINPGPHHVEGVIGTQHAVSDLTITVNQNARAVLHFDAALIAAQETAPSVEAPATPAAAQQGSLETAPKAVSGTSPLHALGWVGIGVGGAGLVLGGLTGVLALGKHSDIEHSPNCSNNHCLSDERSTVNSYNSLRALSSVGFIAGGVLAATGVVLLLNSSSAEAAPTAILLGPSGAALQGQF